MRRSFKKVFTATISLALAIGSMGPIAVLAATTPSLGAAISYGVLSSTYSNTSASTTINGDVGFTTPPAVSPLGVHANFGSGAPYSTAGTNQGSALSALAAQPCTFTFGGGAIDLSTDATHGPIGVYAPGVYCGSGSMDVGGPVTLTGSGTYIFRPGGALTSTVGSVVTLSGASACDVFWTPVAATTLAATSTFAGTVIDDAGITMGGSSTWLGRALAFGGTVTTGTADTITVPSCSTTSTTPVVLHTGNINVVKLVINDNGQTKTVADFPLFVNGTPVTSGDTNSFPAPGDLFSVTEANDANYSRSFSGDCDANGQFNLNPGDNKFCIITNNDIGAPVVVPPVPPLIDVVKVPSPLALPAGPGAVTYTYTTRNIGTVPMSNVTMVGDSCSPILLVSGDANNDAKLDVNETWTYRCSTNLTETHTNTVVASGTANGLTATDIASATVVVGVPIVPPLIHITKIPNPITLPAGGGFVTYTKTVTNPGTVALSNVRVTDDQCSPINFISGDSNNDNKLDPSETWKYTCRTNLTSTTTNTAFVTGEANGLTARDFAIATVVVASAVPKLPNTGFAPNNLMAAIVEMAGGVLAVSLLLYLVGKKQSW